MSDAWDFYFLTVDHKPASIFVDLGIQEEVPFAGFDDFAWLRLYMRKPRPDGLSSDAEFDRLREIEVALTQATSASSIPVAYVGRNTTDGCRDYYCYSANGLHAERVLSEAMVPFPEYEFETGSRSDPEWAAYFEFLYPSKRSYQMILNGRVLNRLEELGDRHEVERTVSHWAYFSSPEDRARFLEAVVRDGFELVHQDDDAGEARPFGIQVSRTHAVEFQTINTIVLTLFDLAEECNGEYDGWESPVETETKGP